MALGIIERAIRDSASKSNVKHSAYYKNKVDADRWLTSKDCQFLLEMLGYDPSKMNTWVEGQRKLPRKDEL